METHANPRLLKEVEDTSGTYTARPKTCNLQVCGTLDSAGNMSAPVEKVGQPNAIYRYAGRPRLVRTGLLLSSALLLSTLLPLPWSPARVLDLSRESVTSSADPSEQWKDDVWPLREKTPWDISTDFPFPRRLEYDVTEGTWLRLDVHPKTGDIIFDMLGDIYCLPAIAYTGAQIEDYEVLSRAIPVLLGVPHDSDPHFSPDGDKIVFRSDAELGVENIWIREWAGCEASDLRPAHAANTELSHAMQLKTEEEDLLANGVRETAERKQRRLLREGRLNSMYLARLLVANGLLQCTARRVTKEK